MLISINIRRTALNLRRKIIFLLLLLNLKPPYLPKKAPNKANLSQQKKTSQLKEINTKSSKQPIEGLIISLNKSHQLYKFANLLKKAKKVIWVQKQKISSVQNHLKSKNRISKQKDSTQTRSCKERNLPNLKQTEKRAVKRYGLKKAPKRLNPRSLLNFLIEQTKPPQNLK